MFSNNVLLVTLSLWALFLTCSQSLAAVILTIYIDFILFFSRDIISSLLITTANTKSLANHNLSELLA